MKNKLILLLYLLICGSVFAQIPQNNLGKSVQQLRSKFPSLKYIEAKGNLTEYEADGITFTFNGGKCVAECMGVDRGRQYGYDWFIAMNQSFLKTSYLRVTELSNDGMVASRKFYYRNFWITLAYWLDDGFTTITYQNSDYFK